MKLFVTGATGFVGQAVVEAAIVQGHEVAAIVRPATASNRLDHLKGKPNFRTVPVDLRDRKNLTAALEGTDQVLHLAATKAGDFYSQFAGTVVATENLMLAMAGAGVSKLIGISTFSVYDYSSIPSGTLIDESSPLATDTERRDEYARTKLLQEDLYRTFGSVATNQVVILRPGMIFGPGELWHALLGSPLGPRFLRIGGSSVLPLTYVKNCADAIVAAAEKLEDSPETVAGEVINIVDDDLPTQRSYVKMVSNHIDPPKSFTVPWPVVKTVAQGLSAANARFAGGRAKFPGIVVPERLNARFKPLQYTNAKARRLLGWRPKMSLNDAIIDSTENEGNTPTPSDD